jgi:hypothetical protein
MPRKIRAAAGTFITRAGASNLAKESTPPDQELGNDRVSDPIL